MWTVRLRNGRMPNNLQNMIKHLFDGYIKGAAHFCFHNYLHSIQLRNHCHAAWHSVVKYY